MTKCTCPSGDGSLQWPCPSHPPTESSNAKCIWPDCGHDTNRIGYGASGCDGAFCPKPKTDNSLSNFLLQSGTHVIDDVVITEMDVMGEKVRMFIDVSMANQDKTIRDKLIEMGWTPPRTEPPHPDDVAVDHFAAEMKAKLAVARAKGRGGWEDTDFVSGKFLSKLLREHVEKGDPRDVANFCCFLWNRGESIAQLANAGSGEAVAMYQVRPRSFPDGEGWREVSRRQYDDYGDPPGFPADSWERRKLYAGAQPAVDADGLIRECLPLAATCDPRTVAAHIREYFRHGRLAGGEGA